MWGRPSPLGSFLSEKVKEQWGVSTFRFYVSSLDKVVLIFTYLENMKSTWYLSRLHQAQNTSQLQSIICSKENHHIPGFPHPPPRNCQRHRHQHHRHSTHTFKPLVLTTFPPLFADPVRLKMSSSRWLTFPLIFSGSSLHSFFFSDYKSSSSTLWNIWKVLNHLNDLKEKSNYHLKPKAAEISVPLPVSFFQCAFFFFVKTNIILYIQLGILLFI